jgi:hypothetical protein
MCSFGVPAGAAIIITPTFTPAFNANFGVNAAAAQNAWKAAAAAVASNFSDNIHINITVDAVPGTSTFGMSDEIFGSLPYSSLYNAVVADARTFDDAAAIGAGGSVTSGDPIGGIWVVTRPQAKALGLLADDLNNDGTTTFGAGYNFSFSGTPTGGAYDFQGLAAHEMSEVMGRLGVSGFLNHFSLIDEFSYFGPSARQAYGGASNYFSIDNGATLLKLFNDNILSGLTSRDWAPVQQGGDGSPDAFNQYSSPNVINSVTELDLRVMDVIGYDRLTSSGAPATPEPSTSVLLIPTFAILITLLWRRISPN